MLEFYGRKFTCDECPICEGIEHIEVDGLLLFGGTNETVEFGKDDCAVSMELSAVGIG